jgi:hypothetical protein
MGSTRRRSSREGGEQSSAHRAPWLAYLLGQPFGIQLRRGGFGIRPGRLSDCAAPPQLRARTARMTDGPMVSPQLYGRPSCP